VAEELRALHVADVLLDLVVGGKAEDDGMGRSVAESVIIYLHGHQKCEEVVSNGTYILVRLFQDSEMRCTSE